MNAMITSHDLIPLSTYRKSRDEYIHKMIAYKQSRRIRVNEFISLLFENRQTVLFQIQELVNSEDLTDHEEIAEYIEIYSAMLPAEDELSATLFIEIDDLPLLEETLRKLKGIEHTLFIEIGEERIAAIFEEEHNDREFTTSVHYLKFPLSELAKQYLLEEPETSAKVHLILDHPQLHAETALLASQIRSLKADFSHNK
ncbi:DUF3501 family protein [Sulfoacidibacillus thermotolerans]|nr:DUF3501 family protein [Sulfoacidibacillus thermotolerans]